MKNNILDNLDKIIFQLKKDFNMPKFILEETEENEKTEKNGKDSTYGALRKKINIYSEFLNFLAEEYNNWCNNYKKNNIDDFIAGLFSDYKKDAKNGKSLIKLKSMNRKVLENLFQLYIEKYNEENENDGDM